MSNATTTNRILVIDDEQQFRDLAVDTLQPVLPDRWEMVAPHTLESALQTLTNGNVRIALIDRSIDSHGYQPLKDDGITYENFRGFQVAQMIASQHPEVFRIAFSKGHGQEFRNLADKIFYHKVELVPEFHDCMRIRANFQHFILEAIAESVAKRPIVC